MELTINEIGALLEISPRTALLYVHRGLLPGRQNPVSRRWVVEKTAVKHLLRERQRAQLKRGLGRSK